MVIIKNNNDYSDDDNYPHPHYKNNIYENKNEEGLIMKLMLLSLMRNIVT